MGECCCAINRHTENDGDFRKELEAQTSKDERMKFAKAQGFDFTKEEIDSLKDELRGDQLEQVVGGILDYCHITAGSVS